MITIYHSPKVQVIDTNRIPSVLQMFITEGFNLIVEMQGKAIYIKGNKTVLVTDNLIVEFNDE